MTAFDCPSDTDMVWHFSKIFEGYLTLMIAPLPRHYLSQDPDQGPGQRRRASARTRSPRCRSRARSSTSPSRPQAELRLVQNDHYQNPRTGKPANLDSVVFKWYGDPDAMIAGFRAGEIDLAFDLQDSDIPKVQDLGDQVARHPGPPVRVPAAELVARPVQDGRPQPEHRRLLAQPGGPGPRHRLPDCRSGDPPGDRLRDRQERDQHAPPRRQRPGREHRTSARRPGSTRTRPRRRSTRPRPSRSSPTAAGLTPTATASSRRTASRPRSSCAPRPARSARTPSRSSARGSRTSASTA